MRNVFGLKQKWIAILHSIDNQYKLADTILKFVLCKVKQRRAIQAEANKNV